MKRSLTASLIITKINDMLPLSLSSCVPLNIQILHSTLNSKQQIRNPKKPGKITSTVILKEIKIQEIRYPQKTNQRKDKKTKREACH